MPTRIVAKVGSGQQVAPDWQVMFLQEGKLHEIPAFVAATRVNLPLLGPRGTGWNPSNVHHLCMRGPQRLSIAKLVGSWKYLVSE